MKNRLRRILGLKEKKSFREWQLELNENYKKQPKPESRSTLDLIALAPHVERVYPPKIMEPISFFG